MKYFVVSLIIASFLGYSLQQGQNIFQNPNHQDTKNSAVTPRNSTTGCVCVPYYLCKKDSITNTDGGNLINIRNNQGDGECPSFLDLCCMPRNVKQVPIKTDPAEYTSSGCGYRNEGGVGFRVTLNDDEAQYGEFPWVVAVLKEGTMNSGDKDFIFVQCGGALIHPQAVLTAAHCVSDRSKPFKIRAGEWDTRTIQEIFPHQDRSVESVEIYPDFYAGALLNDIAVLILDEPFQLAENVDVICLPPQGEVIPEGTRCFATGWGKDALGETGQYRDILKRVELPVVQKEKCQMSLRTTRLGAFFQLHKSFICAGGEPGKDTCKGDGGSPLVCPIPGLKGRYQHAGIVAWGIGCGENNVPGVYANVALFTNWIDDQIKKYNLDTKSYNY